MVRQCLSCLGGRGVLERGRRGEMDVMVILLRCVVSFEGFMKDNDGLVWSRMTFESDERVFETVREIVLHLFKM